MINRVCQRILVNQLRIRRRVYQSQIRVYRRRIIQLVLPPFLAAPARPAPPAVEAASGLLAVQGRPTDSKHLPPPALRLGPQAFECLHLKLLCWLEQDPQAFSWTCH